MDLTVYYFNYFAESSLTTHMLTQGTETGGVTNTQKKKQIHYKPKVAIR